jgi:hypothetical protein
VALIVREIDETRADFIALAAWTLSNSPNLHFSRKGLTRQFKTQAATRAFFPRLTGVNQDPSKADVEEADG